MKLILLAFTLAAALVLYTRASAQWPSLYDYETSVDWGNKIAVDHHGNIYVAGTGTSTASGHGTDWVVLKIDPSGSVVWRAKYDGSAHGNDYATDIAIDWQGYVYIAGVSRNVNGSTTSNDFTVVKADPSTGLSVWPNSGTYSNFAFYFGGVHLIDSNDDGVDSDTFNPSGIDCALILKPGEYGADNFAITGPTSNGIAGVRSWRTVVFGLPNEAGQRTAPIVVRSGWPVDTHGTAEIGEDVPYDIGWASDNSIYVTGGMHTTSGENMMTIRYAAAGTDYSSSGELWRCGLGTAIKSTGRAIVLGRDDVAYVTGHVTDSSSTGRDGYTAAINTSGSTIWTQRYDYNSDEEGTDIDLSFEMESGVLVPYVGVCGWEDTSGAERVYAVRYRGSDGAVQWSDRHSIFTPVIPSPPEPLIRKHPSIAMQGHGNQYVLCTTYNTVSLSSREDLRLMAFNLSGSSRYADIDYDQVGKFDSGFGLCSGEAGLIRYTGSSFNHNTGNGYDDLTDRNVETATTIPFSSATVIAGTISSGSAGNYTITGDTSMSKARAQVEYMGDASGISNPSELSFRVGTHPIASQMSMLVEIYNVRTSSWEHVGHEDVAAATADFDEVIVMKDHPAEYISSGGKIKVRVQYELPSFTATAHFGNCEWKLLGA